jgi:glycosyltransferase involved in cell wall biosynthesis
MLQERGTRRVAHVTVVHKPSDARIHHKQCRTLAAAGYEVHLLSGGVPVGIEDGIHLHPLSENGERPPLRRQIPRQLRAALTALSLRADLYHLHDPHLIPLGLLLRLNGARVVYDVHDDSPRHARQKLFGRPIRGAIKAGTWMLLQAAARRWLDAFVCASSALAQRFPEQRTVVVGNFPLKAEFTAAPPKDRANPPVALYLGVARRDKGLDTIVEAIRLVPPELGARLRIAGEMRPAGRADAIRALPWADRIEVLPHRSRHTALEELRRASIGLAVLPPRMNNREGWRSNKLFEYMAAGLPVVVPDAPGWRQIVERYQCGLAARAEDPRAVAAAIAVLLRDPDSAREMGHRGRAAVMAELNWEREAPRLLGLYERLLRIAR